MKPPDVPELADLPYADALIQHEGALDADTEYDTVFFERAEFDEPHMPNARFLECAFRQVSITDGRLARASLRDTWMRDVRLTGTNFAEGSWLDVTVIGSYLAGVEVFGSELQRVMFSGCKLDSVNFRASRLTGVTFRDCVLRDVDFAGATLTECSFPGSALSRVDLSKVTMDRTDLRDAELGLIIDPGSLRGAIISSGQLAIVAPVLAAALGIVIDDERPSPPRQQVRS
jgi:uncharacterized protein YjbI with pentapeptide repeats